ncbi:MAG TPA: D-2-hydroxyacid dehydrogenase [Pseudolabrys sp.]|nr:D-2-hydroxyacid dehydrogenase [Pseudolabrys sp.]
MAARHRDAKLRVHVQQSKDSLDVFQVTKERLFPMLAKQPAVLERVDFSFGHDRASLDKGIADAEVMMVGNFESERLKERAPQLKWVQSIFAGVEKLAPFIPDGITLTNGSGIHAPKAGEYAMCALLMLNSNVPKFMSLQREKRFEPVFTDVIAGKTVVILGTGKIGIACAEQAKHLGMKVIGVSRSGKAVAGFDRVDPIARLADVLPQAKFLISTLPNTAETKHLLGSLEFGRMPDGAGFVSLGRGQVVDEKALASALQSGKLGGAVLDVFEEEPLPASSPLWDLDNVVLSAHCAVDDLENYLQRAVDVFADNVARYLDGKPLQNVIDTKLGY